MTIRSKILAAALGLVMASGAIGGALADTGTTLTAAPSKIEASTKTVAPKSVVTTKTSVKTIAVKHRLHFAHRRVEHKLVAHRIMGRSKLAQKIGRTHVVMTHQVRAKIARAYLGKTHLVTSKSMKSRIVAAPLVKTHVASRLVGTQKHAMRTTKTIIR